MKRLGLSWMVSLSVVLAVVFSSVLIYADYQLSQKEQQRLPAINSTNSGSKLEINNASSTSTFPSSTTQSPQTGDASPQPPQTQTTSQPPSTDQPMFPVDPIPCKNYMVHECAPFYCPDYQVNASDSCTHCRGVDLSQFVCIEL